MGIFSFIGLAVLLLFIIPLLIAAMSKWFDLVWGFFKL